MVALALAWLVLLIVELTAGLAGVLLDLTWVIWGVFVADFILRASIAPRLGAFLRRNWLTALSLLVPALRVFRLGRALALIRGARGIRAVRVVGSFNRAVRSLGRTFGERGVGYVVAVTAVVVMLGAAAMLAFEGGDPGFGDYPEAVWWTAMMVTSVGSEAWPASPEGRIVAFVLALYGFSILGYLAATLTSFFLGRSTEAGNDDLLAELEALREEVARLRES